MEFLNKLPTEIDTHEVCFFWDIHIKETETPLQIHFLIFSSRVNLLQYISVDDAFEMFNLITP